VRLGERGSRDGKEREGNNERNEFHARPVVSDTI